MKTIKEKIEDYQLKIKSDGMIEPSVRMYVNVALTNVIEILKSDESFIDEQNLIHENEMNIFYRKIYARFCLGLLGLVTLLIYLM